MKRSRRGGRRPQGGTSGHNSSGGNTFNPNRIYDSSGPEIKIRGTASHVYEKYLQLARDANASGDRVMAENYLQHAEHYFRIMAAMQAQAAAQAEAKQAALAAAQPSAPSAGQPEDAPATPSRPSRPKRSVAPAPGVGEQPSLGDDAGPSFSLDEAASDEDDDDEEDEDENEKETAPVGE